MLGVPGPMAGHSTLVQAANLRGYSACVDPRFGVMPPC